ncbi:hypothetical protein ACN20G_07385 [Streptomyces sp. BI20]|uniref:hypothetical protein n=1 Tax=Streptomyces sp. BI20 TaxID=3403460 RepID=UPI003C71ABF5
MTAPSAPAPDAPPARRPGGPADPVTGLLHRHRELVHRAVDPLEIAAGLEAAGIGDRAAARYRHRDVFSLAEELWARGPRREDHRAGAVPTAETPAPTTTPARAPGAGPAPRASLRPAPVARALGPVVLPAVLAGAAAALHAPAGLVWLAAGAAVALPLAPGRVRRDLPVRLALLLLLALTAAGPLADAGPGPALGIALAAVPAQLCVLGHAALVRRRLAGARGLDEFAGRARPLPLLAHLAHLALALPLCLATGAPLGLAAALFAVRLPLAHGARPAPLILACALAAFGPAGAWTAAAALLGHALVTLTRASAHTGPAPRPA